MEQRVWNKQLVVVGDELCGKTSLLVRISQQSFSEGYLPTLFENYAAEVESSQGVVQVSMYDTPGSDNFSHLRPLSYPNSDVLLLCFDLSDDDSYRSLFHKWLPEVRKYCPYAIVYIVGCKRDLQKRNENESADWKQTPPNNEQEVERLLFGTGTNAYFECSSKSGDYVDEILIHYVKSLEQILLPKTRRKSLVHLPKKSIGPNSKLRRHSIAEIRTTQNPILDTNGMQTKRTCAII